MQRINTLDQDFVFLTVSYDKEVRKLTDVPLYRRFYIFKATFVKSVLTAKYFSHNY